MKSFKHIIYCLPFTFFAKTRLKRSQDWIFHGWNEWLITFLILLYVLQGDWVLAVTTFLKGYLAFIAFYEVGYIINDLISVQKEKNPRRRFGNVDVSQGMIALWLFMRLLVFIAVAYWLQATLAFVVFYLCLGAVFAIHNISSSGSLKTFTFIQLAIFRFWAPILFFIPQELVYQLFPVALLYYVFNRTLTYMESKDILLLKERTQPSFRVQSHILLCIFSFFWAFYAVNWLVLAVAFYFSFFWLIIFLISKRTSAG